MERVIDRIYHEGLKALKTVKSFKILTCLALLTSVIQHYLSSFFLLMYYTYICWTVSQPLQPGSIGLHPQQQQQQGFGLAVSGFSQQPSSSVFALPVCLFLFIQTTATLL